MTELPAVRLDPRAAAEEAVRLAAVDSRRALRLAREARTALLDAPDPDAMRLVERALGLVAIELGRMPDAVRHLRRAVTLAQTTGDAVLAAEARLDLSEALLLHGRPESGLLEAERARAALSGPAAARTLVRYALILQRRCRYDEALESYRHALAHLRRAGDQEYEARLLCNRGVLHVYRGELRAAESDLRRAEALHRRLGRPLSVAHIHHNLAFVAARRGNAPEALALYDATEEVYRRLGSNRGILQLDRCQVLLSVNLVEEARQAAEEAVTQLAQGHLDADLPEARLVLSDAAYLVGDHGTAHDQAWLAQRSFTRQGRQPWAAVARYAALRASWAAGARPGTAAIRAAQRTSAQLAAQGWLTEALEARLIAGRLALAAGRVDIAARDLALGGAARRHGPVRLRVAAWHAEALLRLSRGNERGAQAAISAGMRVLDAHRSSLGATELRAHAAGHADELGAIGLRLAIASGRARRVLRAAERSRASTWQPPPPLPPDDPVLAGHLAELRRIGGELRDRPPGGADSARMLQRQWELETAVRRRSHHARGGASALREVVPTLESLSARLGDRVLVELVESDGCLYAVSVRDARARLWTLGPLAQPQRALGALAFALKRLIEGDASTGMQRAHRASAAAAVRRLDGLLLGPLLRELGDRELVLVPPASLHATPWGALPSCVGRPTSVSRSATLWSRCSGASTMSPERGGTLLVAGPELPGAAEEVRELASGYPAATVLAGRDATSAAVTVALGQVELAHIAAHGRFRSDNALFSSLVLADGQLTVYELERVRRMPRRVVLSCCDSGRSSVLAGDELMGLTATLFALGTETVVASVAPVRDDLTRRLMPMLHDQLRQGQGVAAALAAAQAELADPSTSDLGATAFVCFGAG